MAQPDPMKDIRRRLRVVEQKLDVLIEAQGLEGKLAERQAADREESQRKAEERDEQVRRSRRRL